MQWDVFNWCTKWARQERGAADQEAQRIAYSYHGNTSRKLSAVCMYVKEA